MASTPPPLNFDMKVKKLNPNAIVPSKAHESDLGWDLYALDDVIIPPFGRKTIHTGVAIQFPPNVGGILKDRSGIAADSGVHIFAGVIDPEYRGEIKIVMFNSTKVPFSINAEMKIAQMFLMPVFLVGKFEVVNQLDTTPRGEKGFGSSG
jgi:dUTP pyrophosphatase